MAKVRRKKKKKTLSEAIEGTKRPYGGSDFQTPTARVGTIGSQLSARTEPMGVGMETARMGPNPQLTARTGPMNVGMETARGIPPEGMNQQIEAMEMRNQGAPAAESAPMPMRRVRRKKQDSKVMTQKQAEEAAKKEPLSPQTWANMGNNPADYPDYLARWKKQFGKK